MNLEFTKEMEKLDGIEIFPVVILRNILKEQKKTCFTGIVSSIAPAKYECAAAKRPISQALFTNRSISQSLFSSGQPFS